MTTPRHHSQTRSLLAAVAVAIPTMLIGAGLSVPTAQAAIIVEPISINIPATILVGGNADNNFFTNPFAEFNPSSGTLNDVTVTLTGRADWGSTASLPMLSLQLLTATDGSLAGALDFSLPGFLTVNMSGMAETSQFSLFTGTGTTTVRVDARTNDPHDLLAEINGPLTGSITYDFTSTASVPEPASLALLGTGVAGFAFVRRRRRK